VVNFSRNAFKTRCADNFAHSVVVPFNMKQKNPTHFTLDKSSSNPVKFDSGDNTIQVHVVSDRVIRVQHHFSHEGCLKEALSSSFKDFQVSDDTQSSLTIKTSKITVKVNYSPDFYLTWYYNDDLETPFAEDLACRAYPYDPKTGAIWHYTRRNVKDHYYGLGERSGDLDLHGRRFRLERLDCMGYDAENMDPLYKFCPFYITLSGTSKKAHGIYYNNFTRSSFDLGDENDAVS
jgi:alpha-glucosidase